MRGLLRSARQVRAWVRRHAAIDFGPYQPCRHADARRARLVADLGIRTVIDGGANTGQYAELLREHGYRGPIVSFEPGAAAFVELERAARADPSWAAHQLALGHEDGVATLRVSANSYSSSLLPISAAHVSADPETRVVSEEPVKTIRLDSLPASQLGQGPFLLKLDVQGNEPQALEGASGIWDEIPLLELEMSLVPMYEGEQLMLSLLGELAERGFHVVSLDPGFADPRTFRQLQVDVMLARDRT